MKIVSKLGNETLLRHDKTAFVCSRKTPDGLEFLVGKWLLGLSPERDCVMCGNQSPMERAVFTTLLQRRIPTVLALAEAMPSRWNDDVRCALGEGRLLVVTHCDASVHNVTARSAFDRNVLMFSMAEKIVVGCCTKGGRLERALAGFDNVEFLDKGQPWLGTQETATAGPPAAEPARTVLGSWSRQLKSAGGTVFLDFNDTGAETYFKITQSVRAAGGVEERPRLYFDRKELTSFAGAVGFVVEKTAAGKPVPSGLTVASLSGDITFGVSPDGEAPLLAITQSKALPGGGRRVNSVRLSLSELPELVRGIEAALAVWK